MNETIINNWNSKVSTDDTVYILGDLCWKDTSIPELLETLNGEKHFIRGNHDHNVKNFEHLFTSCQDYLKIRVPDENPAFEQGKYQHIIMCHYAFRVWDNSHRGSWSLFGHSHGTLTDDSTSLSIDVGVDCHNFTPLSYEEIKDIMSKKTPKFAFGNKEEIIIVP